MGPRETQNRIVQRAVSSVQPPPSSVRILVRQSAHGWSVGTGVEFAAGTWINLYSTGRGLWGIVDSVPSADSAYVVVNGVARTASTLTPGSTYFCENGAWSIPTTSAQISYTANGYGAVAHALDAHHFAVSNAVISDGLYTTGGVFETIACAPATTMGDLISWSQSGGIYALSIATTSDVLLSRVRGVAIYDLGLGFWICLTSGSADGYYIGSYTRTDATGLPSYVSASTAGLRTGTAPTMPVFAGTITTAYDAGSDITTVSVTAPGDGNAEPHPYPIPAAGLANTAVTPGSYGPAWTATVDAQGRLTAAATQTVGNTYNADQTVKAEGQNFVSSVTGTFWQTTINWQTGAPVFNAKWIRGIEVSTAAPAAAPNFLMYDTASTSWIPYRVWNVSAVTGWVNCYDSTVSDTNGKSTGVMAGTAVSVFGRASNSDGLPAAIAAASNDTILGRRSNALTWAKLALASEVSGLLSIKNGGTDGQTRSTFTTGTGATYTVPAGVTMICVIVIGGGGGGASTSSVSATSYYVASFSGGSPTTVQQHHATGGAGGSGAMCVAFLPVTPGESCTYSVGGGGAAGSAGGTSSFIAASGTISCTGGGGGGSPTTSGVTARPGIGGVGGTVTASKLYIPLPGRNGGDGHEYTYAHPASSNPGSAWISTYGGGGLTGSAGSAGAVIVLY